MPDELLPRDPTVGWLMLGIAALLLRQLLQRQTGVSRDLFDAAMRRLDRMELRLVNLEQRGKQ